MGYVLSTQWGIFLIVFPNEVSAKVPRNLKANSNIAINVPIVFLFFSHAQIFSDFSKENSSLIFS